MISTTDIENLLVLVSEELGIEDVYQSGDIPHEPLKEERVVVIADRQTDGVIWKNCYVNVNVCIPDYDEMGTANKARLNEVQREAKKLFDSEVGEYDGTHYLYEWDSDGILEEKEMRYHYVNVRILFQILNVK